MRFKPTTSDWLNNMKIARLSFLISVFITCAFAAVPAQSVAPGGPGKDAQWLTAGKQAFGTSANLESKVWFTLANGVLTEVLYPDVSVANVHLLQFIVVNTKTKKVETERDDATSSVESLSVQRSKDSSIISNIPVRKYYFSPSSMAFSQNTRSEAGKWSISKKYIADPKNNSVLISVNFCATDPDLELYVYYDPSLANSGMRDTGWTEGRFLVSVDGSVASALTCGRCKLVNATNGFLGVNDGLMQLKAKGEITDVFSRAENGNLVQLAKVDPVIMGSKSQTMVFALAFAPTPAEAIASAQRSLSKGFEATKAEYQGGWADYLTKLPKVDPKYQAQFNMAAMVVKSLEDKTVRGGNIASPSVPWGGGSNANEGGSGYRMIWSRDLYHVFTAFLAIGDKAAAERALDFLFKVQQKADGSFPQNSGLNGTGGWGSLQMDEVGYPLIMAWQLGRFDKATYEKHVKPAADFIVKTGPSTLQERWEERPGYSPSTIAAEIAGLVCAADIAKRNGDNASATKYLATADYWQSNIEKWTVTTNGKYGDGNYYLRITANGRPDAGEKVELNNNAGTFDEREIVDAGFLELVRLGIKPANDLLIVKSVKVIDQVIKVETPNGVGFYRYNHDGYGEMDDGRKWNWDGKYTGKGRLWALLSGERGQYEIAECGVRGGEYPAKSQSRKEKAETRPVGSVSSVINTECLERAKSRLDAMLGFANDGLMIPEQVWDKKEVPNADKQFVPDLKFGEGTGSATPLAWSMAQFIRLAVNLKAGRNLDTPQVVYDRYAAAKR